MFFDFLNVPVFLVSLAIGVFFTYVFQEPPRVVFRHPTPENIETTTFRNAQGTCYRYRMRPGTCPAGGGEPIPV